MKPLHTLTRRLAALLRSSRGAFDLTSVLVGAAVVAILVGGTAVTTFGIIPWAQDNGAQQSLSAVSTAQGVAKVRDGKFMDTPGLTGASYMTAGPSLAVGADANGGCWVGFSRSGAGKTFYSTSSATVPQVFTKGLDTGCVDKSQQRALAIAVGTPFPLPTLSTWGYNAIKGLGRVGGDATSPIDLSSGPLAGKMISSVTASNSFTCVVADDAPYCWGLSNFGQLGNGLATDSDAPVPVDVSGALAGKKVTSIASGTFHACVLADGSVYCWGMNTEGQLGVGDTAQRNVPAAVDMSAFAGKKITSISAGGDFTCVLADGTPYCWGANDRGQLGVGDKVGRTVPAAVKTTGVRNGKTVTSIDAGVTHACAIASGSAYCWGYNFFGGLGTGDTTDTTSPAAALTSGALAGKTVTAISAGNGHTCALVEQAAYCWGDNSRNILGQGGPASPTPVKIAGILDGRAVSSVVDGSATACAVSEGQAFCWGYNAFGQLGAGDKAAYTGPVPVSTSGPLGGKSVTQIALSDYHSAAINE